MDAATRSRMMSGIRARNTVPEKQIRSALHRQGLRFRLHGAGLPGKPDLVLARFHTVVFVHGCFWHGHDCRYFKWPKSRRLFWRTKIMENRRRDRRVLAALVKEGWRVLVCWECAVRGRSQDAICASMEHVARWIRSGRGSRLECRGR